MSSKEKIEKIIRQTDYTEDIAREKLAEYKDDEIKVIKAYLSDEKPEVEKNIKILSPHQEIYHQIRSHLNQPNKIAEYLTYKR
jgi:uncharacterized protein YqeY